MGNNEDYLDSLLKSMVDSEENKVSDTNNNTELEDVALPEDILEDLLQKFSDEQGLDYNRPEPSSAKLPIQEVKTVPEPIQEPKVEAIPEVATWEPEAEPMAEPIAEPIAASIQEEEAEVVPEVTVLESEVEADSDSYTVESTLNMSAEEIEQLLANTEQQAEVNTQNTEDTETVNEILSDDMDNEDLLALLGSLDTSADTVSQDQNDSFWQAEQEGFMSQAASEKKESAKAKRESAKEKRERKKLEKQERKAAKKAIKEAAKEAKKAEKQIQKDLDEAVGVVEEESVTSIFAEADMADEGSINIWNLAGGDEESNEADDNVSVNEEATANDAEAVLAWDELLGLTDDEVQVSPADEEEVQDAKKETPKKKKGGAFSRLFAFLTEEDEEENLSEENRSILDELDEEDRKAADKKKKGKKGKQAAGGKKGQEDGEEEGAPDDKKKKKEKKKKEKKPKKVKEVELKVDDFEHPPKRLSSKSIAVILAFAATLFCVIYFGATYFSTQLQRAHAKEAFLRMDYPSCYAGLYGIELNEEETEMLKHAGLVMKAQHYIELYHMYFEESKELEAVDSLMQLVAEYEDTYAEALDCGAGPEIAALYEDALDILKTSYGLNQEDARHIAACESNVEYTRYLTALVEGGSYQPGNSGAEDELQDMLPVEDELLNPDFAD